MKNKPDFTVTEVFLEKSIDVGWITKSAGFGHVVFYLGEDGKLHCDNEYMSRSFIKGVLRKLVDDSVFDEEKG